MKKLILPLIAGMIASFGAALAQSDEVAAAVFGGDEVIKEENPALEARVKSVADTIRCVVCKNQSIAESDAGLAKDLVNLVRERIEAGESDEEVRAYLVDRYGEFILLKPRFSWRNAGLWALPFLVLLAAMVGALGFVRSKTRVAVGPEPLSGEERAELEKLLGTKFTAE